MNKFAVIGHPVAHSLSPAMHAANFAAVGYDGFYEKFDVGPDDVDVHESASLILVSCCLVSSVKSPSIIQL